ncbi:hypothetical protein CAPTEDRAFT_150039 [Capitella teleta]|uniref:Armadillo repeat-containing protein 8 n=1 Tax=Capitella teleta TaxID=283909 RepID=R7UN94_CAPTE|nr:hypothetical protein CAPTEDRAFT_150039 [Capitella teleta]|eukprot:ELU07690.1 hypothetical protein CAPTEDRAFT_150039 [Capitella teleta]
MMDLGISSFEQIFDPDPKCWFHAVRNIKNGIIGNNWQKEQLITLGVVPRLLQFMVDEGVPLDLRLECAVVLGSLAKGRESNVRALIDAGCVPILFKDLNQNCLRYTEACLRCLRTIFNSPYSPSELVYQDPGIMPHLVSIMSKSACTQECVTNILSNCCKNAEQQAILSSNGAIAALAPLLASDNYRVQMPVLRCLAMLCHQNHQVSMSVATATFNGDLITSMLSRLISRDKTTEMQMAAAKCLTYLCRADAISASEPIIGFKTLATLIRLCKSDKTWEERVEGAELLAYLIEVDISLQRMAAISDQIISTLAEYFKYPGSPFDSMLMPTKKVFLNDDILVGNELRQAAFRAYASLGANDEDIRRRIIETEDLMQHIVNGLSDPVLKVQMAAIRCLHSLSRSVQQLRTNFQDHSVWKPIIKLLRNAPEEILIVASSTLCNLLLEFSPSKEPILDSGVVDLLVSLTRHEEPTLRLNGTWALMNMTFQSDQKVRSQIMSVLGADQLFRLLSDPDVNILMKTLGLMRNLLSNKTQIDQIMTIHGTQVMQAVTLILEGDHAVEVKEQALCILANVADGDIAKGCIMGNENILRKVMNYMVHSNVKLQIAGTFCISNLLWNDDEGAVERQQKLRDLGVQRILQQLLGTNDSVLFDRVKTALQQF